jgi:hypothetical protein
LRCSLYLSLLPGSSNQCELEKENKIPPQQAGVFSEHGDVRAHP